MQRRLSAIVLALAAVTAQTAQAQTRFVAPIIPGAVGLPPVPVTGAAMTLSPNVGPTLGTVVTPKTTLLATPVTRAPVLGLSLGRSRVGALAGSGAKAESTAKGAPGVKGGLQALAAAVSPKPGVVSKDAGISLQRFYEAGAQAAAEPGFVGFNASYLDPRVSNALQSLSRSAVGLSVYQEIYKKYGGALQLRVDNDPSATYDSKVFMENGNPVIMLTDNLVRRESPEFTASFITREMAQLYYGAFPASIERDYLAHSVMVRTYAELTGSNEYQWDTRRDRWQQGRYAMKSYFDSWRESSRDYYGQNRKIQDSPFFRYLQGNGGETLDQQYYRGAITPGTYRDMTSYFQQMAQSEYDWLRNNEGRRNP